MAKSPKRIHEIRDPLHDFIQLDRQERMLVDSMVFQRLRHIHQLALTYLVYPGASHKRFEHSLGVAHLAGKVFDVITDASNIHPDVEYLVPDRKNLPYWRTVLCLAALCHDIGHLPFSHAAEKQLLPKHQDHESLTLLAISDECVKDVWNTGFYVNVDHVKKLAVGRKKYGSHNDFSDWEAILSEIIVGDAFGVDRIDYLLRDSYHLGVSYGRFDHLKLIDSLAILPQSLKADDSREPSLGIKEGGLHSAEALLLARYFMYEQVYFHSTRRIYDLHLIDFMKSHYGEGGYKLDVQFHLTQTDNEVLTAMRAAARDPSAPGFLSACAVLNRGHYRKVYSRNPADESVLMSSIENGSIQPKPNTTLSPGYYIFEQAAAIFGKENLRHDPYLQSSNPNQFPVLMHDGRIEESTQISTVLAKIPLTVTDYLFAEPKISDDVGTWIKSHRENILQGKQTT